MKYLGPIGMFAFVTAACGSGTEVPGPADDVSETSRDVIGGTVPAPGARPWQVQISVSGMHHCGGSLVALDWVLTAGHCVEGRSPSDFRLVLGEHDRSVAEGVEQTRFADRIEMHPDYVWSGGVPHNDVALLHLTEPATPNTRVKLIRPAVSNDGASQTASISGWGYTFPSSGPSTLLMEAPLPIATNAACNAAPNLIRDLFTDELCAGYLNGQSGGCHTDSGGPLAVQRAWGTWEQVGVVSWGQGGACGTYTVFARTTAHVRWLRRYVVDPAALVALDLL
jgi:secreted trypsin-like serine protease